MSCKDLTCLLYLLCNSNKSLNTEIVYCCNIFYHEEVNFRPPCSPCNSLIHQFPYDMLHATFEMI